MFKKILSKFKENSSVHLIGEGVDLKFKVHGKKAISDIDFDNMNLEYGVTDIFIKDKKIYMKAKIKI